MVNINVTIPLLYVCLATSLSGGMIFWYEQSMYLWLLSLLCSVFIYNIIHNVELWFSPLFNNAFMYMGSNHQCCCHGKCSKPQHSTTWIVILRTLGGLFACISLFYSIANINHIDITMLKVLWGISSSFWLISCIPMIVCLVQCAAHLKDDSQKTIKTIKHFRTRIALRIVHDVMLGIFWFYLAFMLDKLFDIEDVIDEDEDVTHVEEWRIIFMSMISWHLVIVLIREIYFSEKTYIYKGGCCDTKNLWVWFKLTRVASLILIYTIIIYRVDKPVLYTMGCTVYALIGGIFAIITICIIHTQLEKGLPDKNVYATKHIQTSGKDEELGRLIF